MTVTAPTRSRRRPGAPPPAPGRTAGYVWALTRLSPGWVFFWAFLDKTFGFGHGTPAARAWIHGGHPTAGFLTSSAKGPLAGFYHSLAGAPWADGLFMAGLAGVGVALLLGIGMRVCAVAAAVLCVMMWSAVLPPDNNPFMDYRLVYALVIVGLALVNAGDVFGFGRVWSRSGPVTRFPFLR